MAAIWHEIAPKSVLEALARGKPVVASAIGGLPELIDDGVTGFLVTPGDTAAYRIAVEALTNVARHSGAQQATVRVTRTGEAWRMEIRDPGIGGAWTPGVGMNSMRERAEAVGGQIEAGNGLVRLTLPCAGPITLAGQPE